MIRTSGDAAASVHVDREGGEGKIHRVVEDEIAVNSDRGKARRHGQIVHERRICRDRQRSTIYWTKGGDLYSKIIDP